ncbi:conidial pigment biosynthesis oxidase Arb2/brown2 [Microthyrium microscopicum]|uniref:Conidial pigment biosynthesis oxidase Arb2/brown2 n=1 Tax=Microthyrium microscopicum TaxID=703497 RepID=A0A6A6UGB1_9PEZI|nr:conidial pigment biosynthesis oxidase Arb2/brown2 [Microthyrium microscopicum]
MIWLWSLLASVAYSAHVNFQLDLTWKEGSPDGNKRQMVLMNNQFPGPQLTLNYGDTVQFVVHNRLPFEATVHFHGIDQQGTPWFDGVPGVSQDAIQPGTSFTYDWNATSHGAYWYHAHSRGLMQDGLYGAIIIKPPPGEARPFSMISSDRKAVAAMEKAELNSHVVLVSDWTHITSEQWFAAEEASNLDIYCVDSILINGKGSVGCLPLTSLNSFVSPHLAPMLKSENTIFSDRGCAPMTAKFLGEGDFNDTKPNTVPETIMNGCKTTTGSQEVFQVEGADGWASFHFIGATALKMPTASIDEHPMWVYAVDGQYIRPQMAHNIPLRNGERYSVMVRLDKTPGDYQIRIANTLPNQILSGFAKMSYTGGSKRLPSKPYINYAGINVTRSVMALDENQLLPFNAPYPAQTADATHILTLARLGHNYRWTLNNKTSYSMELEKHRPLLFYPNPNGTIPADLVVRTKMNTWVDIIFVVDVGDSNPAQPPHSMHKHGNKMYFIGSGVGPFVWPSVEEAMKVIPQNFKITNAPYRDTVTTAQTRFAPTWIAMRYHVENPGAFILHCHMLTHVEGGMAVILMDGVDEWPKIPADILNGVYSRRIEK